MLVHDQIVHQHLEKSVCPSCLKRFVKDRISDQKECSEAVKNFAPEIIAWTDIETHIVNWVKSISNSNDDVISTIDGVLLFKTDVVSLCGERWVTAGPVAIEIKAGIKNSGIKVEAIGPELMVTYFSLPEKMEPAERAAKAGCLFDGEFIENV